MNVVHFLSDMQATGASGAGASGPAGGGVTGSTDQDQNQRQTGMFHKFFPFVFSSFTALQDQLN